MSSRGPRVRVVFAGDPLPENRRDDAGARSARSAASISICSRTPAATSRAYLRQQGYRAAEAPYVREERERRDGADLHRHAADCCIAWRRSRSSGNSAVPRAELAPLLR